MELRIAEQQERAANAERALLELQQRTRPRSLTQSERQALLAALESATSKGPVEVSSPTGDGEARNYARQLMEVLKEAGWPLANEEIFAELVTGVGTHVVVRNSAAPPASAAALRNSLSSAGIQYYESSQPENIPAGTVRLAVKSKPQ